MMLSRRGAPRLSQVLAGYGRYGDTMLAHINPQEAALLKSRGGAGTVNPITGIREFYTGARGGQGAPGGTGPGAAAAAGGMGGLGGADRRDMGFGGVARGGQGAPGGAGPSAAQAAGMGIGGLGGAGRASGAPSSGIGSQNAAIGTVSKAKEGIDTGLGYGSTIGGVLGGVAAGPLGGVLGGLLGGLADQIGGWGNVSIGGQSVTDARNSAYGGMGSSSGVSVRGAEGPGRETTATRSRGTKPVMTPPDQGPVPTTEPPPVPDWIKQIAGDNLSPIQLRSLIATQGSQGLDAAYRDMATLDYYRKLLKSSVKNYGDILPVEHRYLQDVYGFQYQPTLQDFYRIIGG